MAREEGGGARSPRAFFASQAWSPHFLGVGVGGSTESINRLWGYLRPKQVRDEGTGKAGTVRNPGGLETISEHLWKILSYSFLL